MSSDIWYRGVRARCDRRGHRRLAVLASGIFGLAMFASVAVLQAATYSWTLPPPQSDDWATATNWGGFVPTSADDVYIVNGGSATIGPLGASCGTLSLGSTAGSGFVRMTDGAVANLGAAYVGNTGQGTFSQAGGSATINNAGLILGYTSSGSGAYRLSGSGVLTSSNEYIGYRGTGNFVQTGGTNLITSGVFSVAGSIGAVGNYYLTGNALLFGGPAGETIGTSGGFGTFVQTGGTNNVGPGGLAIGGPINYEGSLPTGTYYLGGNGLLMAQSATVTATGLGIFTQTGGTNRIAGDLYVDGSQRSLSTPYTLSGSGVLSASNEFIGARSMIASFLQTGGTNVCDSLKVGTYHDSLAIYSLNGGLLAANSITLAQGNLVFGGGTLQAKHDGAMFSPYNGQTPLALVGASDAIIDTQGFSVSISALGSSGTNATGGLTTLSGGTLVIDSCAYPGPTKFTAGTLILGNSTGYARLTGPITASNGTLILGNGSGGAYANGPTTVTNGVLIVGNGASSGYVTGALTVSSGTLIVGNGTGSVTCSGGISLNNASAILGNGTASTTVSGSVSLNGGSLIVGNGTGTATVRGSVSIGDGLLATGNSGTITGPVTLFGGTSMTIAPGGIGGIGTLALGSSLSLYDECHLLFDVSGGSADRLAIAGKIFTLGSIDLDIDATGPLSGIYTLMTYGTSGGLFPDELVVTGVPAGYTVAVDSRKVQLVPAPVPEPTIPALVTVAALVAVAHRAARRRCRALWFRATSYGR